MHLFVPQGYGHLVFNVDGKVGQNCPNNPEDVLLVQFLLPKAVEKTPMDWERRERVNKVPTNGYCDDLTTDGIKAVQEHMREKNPGTVVDGIVSPAHGVVYGEGAWTIVVLNTTIRENYPDVWPRLHDFPDCPGPLAEKVKKLL